MDGVHTLQKRMLDGENEQGINTLSASRCVLPQFIGCKVMVRRVLEKITLPT
jgi:ribosomal protein S19